MPDRETGFFRGSGGSVWQMDLPLSENMRDQLTKGYLTRVTEDGSPYVEPADDAEPEQPPAANANKAAWIGYAHRVHDVPIDDAEAMTKTDLIELYGPSA